MNTWTNEDAKEYRNKYMRWKEAQEEAMRNEVMYPNVHWKSVWIWPFGWLGNHTGPEMQLSIQ